MAYKECKGKIIPAELLIEEVTTVFKCICGNTVCCIAYDSMTESEIKCEVCERRYNLDAYIPPGMRGKVEVIDCECGSDKK